MKPTYLFDLDGTLTDPFEGITNSIVYALKKFDIEVDDKSKLIPFIGPPLYTSFTEIYGFDEQNANAAVKYYREYFSEKGMFENKVYDGIVTVLQELKNRGNKLVIATSKPEQFTLKILKHFDLYKYFDFVAAATFSAERVEKADIIAYALKECKFIDKDKAVMIGDRKFDISGAKQSGLKCAGVTYGYGTFEELKNAGADYIVKTPLEILDIKI